MDRDFRLFWTGRTVSAFGSTFTVVAIPFVAVRVLHATPWESGLVAAASAVPALALAMPIGVWADRLRRKRRGLIIADLLAATGISGLAAMLAFGRASLPALTGMVAALAVVGLYVETVYFVHLRSLVPAEKIVSARARLQVGSYVGDIVGRSLVGALIAALGVATAFVLDALTYVISAVTLRMLRTPDPEKARPAADQQRSFRREMVAGMAAVFGHPFLRWLAILVVGLQVCSGAASALVAQFLLNDLAIPTAWYGTLFILLGAAGAAGSAWSVRLAGKGADPVRMTLGGFFAAAFCTALLPMASGPILVAAVVAAAGIGLPYFFGAVANVGVTSLTTVAVPEHLLGRLAGTMRTLITAAMAVGALLGGAVAASVGVRTTLWLTCVGYAACLFALRPLHRARAAVAAPAHADNNPEPVLAAPDAPRPATFEVTARPVLPPGATRSPSPTAAVRPGGLP